MPQWMIHNGYIDEKWRSAVQGIELGTAMYAAATTIPQLAQSKNELIGACVACGVAYWQWNEWVGAKKTALA